MNLQGCLSQKAIRVLMYLSREEWAEWCIIWISKVAQTIWILIPTWKWVSWDSKKDALFLDREIMNLTSMIRWMSLKEGRKMREGAILKSHQMRIKRRLSMRQKTQKKTLSLVIHQQLLNLKKMKELLDNRSMFPMLDLLKSEQDLTAHLCHY